MHRSIVNFIKQNAIAFLALFFAIGGGGGYALAATKAPAKKTTTIHACEVKRTGELVVAKKCNKRQKAVVWNQRGPAGVRGKTGAKGATGVAGAAGAPGAQGPAGPVAETAWGLVAPGPNVGQQGGTGYTVSYIGTGHYQVTLTSCTGVSKNGGFLEVTPQGDAQPNSANPPVVANVDGGSIGGHVFGVYLSTYENGAWTPVDSAINLVGGC